jgi:hypothetical protein
LGIIINKYIYIYYYYKIQFLLNVKNNKDKYKL